MLRQILSGALHFIRDLAIMSRGCGPVKGSGLGRSGRVGLGLPPFPQELVAGA